MKLNSIIARKLFLDIRFCFSVNFCFFPTYCFIIKRNFFLDNFFFIEDNNFSQYTWIVPCFVYKNIYSDINVDIAPMFIERLSPHFQNANATITINCFKDNWFIESRI